MRVICLLGLLPLNMGPYGLAGGTNLLLFWAFNIAVAIRHQESPPYLTQPRQTPTGGQLNWQQLFARIISPQKNAPLLPKKQDSAQQFSHNENFHKTKPAAELWRKTILSIAAAGDGEHVLNYREARSADKQQVLITRSKRSDIPRKYLLVLCFGQKYKPSKDDLDDLFTYLSERLHLPKNHIHVQPPYLNENGDYYVEVYFTRVRSDPASTRVEDLIPAHLVTTHLSVEQIQQQLPYMEIQIIDTGAHSEMREQTDLEEIGFLRQPYFPYVLVAVCVAILILIFIMVWCCLHQKNKKNASLSSGYGSSLSTTQVPQQICLYPSAKPAVGTATMIQPEVSQIITNKACGECGTPVRGSPFSGSGVASPILSGGSSNAGTPNPGTPTLTGSGTPIHTPPLRLKKGLLERRGSNASLTIDLGSSISDSPTMGSPPRESTAEEYLLSAGNRMSRKQLRNCLKNVSNLYEEFWEIPMNHPDKIEVAGSGMKNRYRTIIPNETTRVKLPETDGDPMSGYINANYIRGYNNEPKTYIATQGPMSNTIGDFWRMMWQERAPIIVMITKLKEKNRTKCEGYLPEQYETYGNLEVFVHNVTERDGYQVRQITIKYINEEHRVLHYWYTAWPDHKAPNTAKTLLELVKEVEQQRADPILNPHRGPVIIHCSAGIGRTGCFIATSTGMKQLQEEGMVDVLGVVCGMRLDRGGMVQTNEQYEFIHHTLCLFEKELPEHPPSNG